MNLKGGPVVGSVNAEKERYEEKYFVAGRAACADAHVRAGAAGADGLGRLGLPDRKSYGWNVHRRIEATSE